MKRLYVYNFNFHMNCKGLKWQIHDEQRKQFLSVARGIVLEGK
jgi:hypothetical protein